MEDLILITQLNDFIFCPASIYFHKLYGSESKLLYQTDLSRFGHRLQYSVFEIDNSTRILNNIITDLKNKYERAFSQSDSVIIFKMSSSCEIIRYGYAKNDEKDFIII